jgi:predicted RNase H-like nuclease (RuvC/YqgF family)
VVGATERQRIEAEIDRLATRQEDLESKINALDSREDEVYRRWRDEYHERRYQAPKVTRLFRVAFRIEEPKTSC